MSLANYEMRAPNAMQLSAVPNSMMNCSWEVIEEDFFEISTCAGTKVMYGVKIFYQSVAGSVKSYPAPSVAGYVDWWGSANLDSVYIQPRRGLTPTHIELTPLSSAGKVLRAGHKITAYIYQPFVG